MLPSLQRLSLCPTGMEAPERKVAASAAPSSVPSLSPDLVRAVLATISTGDAKKACAVASAWCATDKNHHAACVDADPVWAMLTAAVFTPSAPTLNPSNGKANFDALCNRIADYETGEMLLQAGTPDVLIRPFVRAAVQHDPVAALSVATTFQTDRLIMREAVQINGLALQFGFEFDVEMCMLAVASNGLALQYVARMWRQQRDDITLRAVQQNGLALQFALEPVCYQSRVLYAAVLQNGNALRYAGPWWQGYYGLVMEAVTNKGGALRWANKQLQDNESIVIAALVNDGSALEYASPRLQSNEKIRAVASSQLRYG